jgi:hypothetical protein
VAGEQHEDSELRQRQVGREERTRAVMSKQVLEALLAAHNVRDEVFLAGQRQPFVRDALMADPGPSSDGRYQRSWFTTRGEPRQACGWHTASTVVNKLRRGLVENHLFASGKLLVPAERFSGEHTCQS